MKKVALITFTALIALIILAELTSDRRGYAYNVGAMFARQAFDGQTLSSPEMKRAIADINNQLAIVTKDKWTPTDSQVKESSAYWHKVLVNR